MAPRPQLLEGLAFYGAYHNDPWNQLIHVIFVPPPPPPPPPDGARLVSRGSWGVLTLGAAGCHPGRGPARRCP